MCLSSAQRLEEDGLRNAGCHEVRSVRDHRVSDKHMAVHEALAFLTAEGDYENWMQVNAPHPHLSELRCTVMLRPGTPWSSQWLSAGRMLGRG
jgi:hypothetical protein